MDSARTSRFGRPVGLLAVVVLSVVSAHFLVALHGCRERPPEHGRPPRTSFTADRDAANTGSISDADSPRLPEVLQVGAADDFSCVLLKDGTVRCWGANVLGQLGNGTTQKSSRPVPVIGLTDVTQIAVGGSHACALRRDRALRCWGNNTNGALGDGTQEWSTLPVPVPGIEGVERVWASRWRTTCARLPGATYKCWGNNNAGQIPDGSTADSLLPVGVPAFANAADLAMGEGSTCTRSTSGAVKCYGQLGKPVSIAVTAAADVALGDGFGCAIENGAVRCWGINSRGQLGNGGNAASKVPVTVPLPMNAKAIRAGSDHVCAILNDGAAYCWGGNGAGQLGDGFTTDRSSPIAVRLPKDVALVEISLGRAHTCALTAAGAVLCWGGNTYGQLGGETWLKYRPNPAPVEW